MTNLLRVLTAGILLGFGAQHLSATPDPDLGPDNNAVDPALPNPAVTNPESESVQWGPLLKQSFSFLAFEHGFRIATDRDTKNGFKGSFFGGYLNAVGNLHGWADGDPFVVNYIGHPIQGSIAGDIWLHNDPRYQVAEFGKTRRYWTGKIRATAFSWAYSEQFEIGPLSEASIGHIQKSFPQQGFVDHVITPTIGLAWMVAEDAIDRYVIRNIEEHTDNRYLRILARGFLNPSRTFANCMELEMPWHRDSRPQHIGEHIAHGPVFPDRGTTEEKAPLRSVPLFEFAVNFNQTAMGITRENRACTGGGASGIFNLNSVLAIDSEVSGCHAFGLGTNLSGDSTTFAIGPRFTYRAASHLAPWVHILAGGEKRTEEQLLPDVKTAVIAANPGVNPHALHDQYTLHSESTGFALVLGGGVDWVLNRFVAFRMGNFDYVHSWTRDVIGHQNDVRFSTGFVLRTGG